MAAEALAEVAFRAAQGGDAGAVSRLLDEDPRLLSTTWERDTLLTRAVRAGHVGVVRVLHEREADLDTHNADGSTALHRAAQRAHEEMVLFLLSHGADPRRRGYRGRTALMYASVGGHVAVVRLLLRYLGERGLDERDEDGCTALFGACCRGHPDILRALLLAGADHTIANNQGRTPQQAAQTWSQPHCVALIQWWENELERGYLLHQARCLMEQQRLLPPVITALSTTLTAAGPLPSYVVTRLRPHPLPTPELICLVEQSEAAVGKDKSKEPGDWESPSEEQKDAILKFVMHDLAHELYIELLEGFHK